MLGWAERELTYLLVFTNDEFHYRCLPLPPGQEFAAYDRLDIVKSTKSWLEQKIHDRREEQTPTIAALKILNKEIQRLDSGIRLLVIWEWFKGNNARGTMITYLSKKSDGDQDEIVSSM